MDVLIVSKNDWANMGYRFQESLRSVGIDAKAVTLGINYSCRPKHAQVCSVKKIRRYAQSAKIIQFMHSEYLKLDVNDKRVFVFHGGGLYREQFKKLNRIFNPIVEKSIIQTGDLFGLGAKNEVWVLPAVDTHTLQPVYRQKSNKIIIGHFPSGERVKNSPGIREVIEKVRKDLGHKFEYIFSGQRVPWAAQIKRVSECDIYIEACKLELGGERSTQPRKYGEWGVAAIEAAALGKVVISHFLSHKKYEKEYGKCVIKVANSLNEIEGHLRKLLLLDTNELFQIRKDTRAWVEKYHSYKVVGERLKKVVYEI